MIDAHFDLLRQVLDTRRSELKDLGLGNKPQQAVPLSDEDVEMCWATGAFGSSTPRVLQNTVYFFFSNAFGWRGRHEQYNIEWKDLTMINEGTEDEHLHWNETVSKTRKGKGPPRVFCPNMWLLEDKERCPVLMYKRIRDKRSEEQKQPNHHFFLTPHRNATWDMEFPWKHGKKPNMSDGAIGNIMVEVKKTAGLTGAITAHTVRKTYMTNLLRAGVPANLIIQYSGHKSLDSINSYSVASVDQQKEMYEIAVNRKRSYETVVAPGSSMLKKRAPPPVIEPVEDLVEEAPAPQVPGPMVVAPAAGRTALQAPATGVPQPQDIMAGIFAGATIHGSVHVHIHYGNVASTAQTTTQVHVSPTIPHVELTDRSSQ